MFDNFTSSQNQFAALSDRIWEGHSRAFEDLTHVVAGVGMGLIACSGVGGDKRPAGFALVMLAAALHLYAFLTARPRRPASPFGAFFGSR